MLNAIISPRDDIWASHKHLLFLSSPSVAADPLEDLLGPFPCARLRGLPFEATVDDVLRFFQGLVILDVVMVIRADGRGAGEALVVFSNHMSLSMALSRDKQHMGRRYIEIFQAKRIDYYHRLDCIPSGHGQTALNAILARRTIFGELLQEMLALLAA